MSTVLGSALAGYHELVSELGADPAAILTTGGLEPDDVGRPDALISFHRAVWALEVAAEITGTKDFGRRLAERQSIEILGPIGAAIRTAPTMGEALVAAGRYMPIYSPVMTVELDHPDGWENVRLTYRILPEHQPSQPYPHTMELALGVTFRVLRVLGGPRFRPASVHLPHQAIASPANYRAYFGCRAEFESPFGGFGIRPDDIARPVSGDDQVRTVVNAYLDATLQETPSPDDVVATTAATIRRLLPVTAVDLELIAEHLSSTPRTLQRRLADRGTGFENLLDHARRDLATGLLRDTDLPLSEISTIVGYSAQSGLSRAAQRWFGMSPTEARHEFRDGEPSAGS